MGEDGLSDGPSPFSGHLLTLSLCVEHQVIHQTLKIWSQFQNKFGLQTPSLMTPILSNHLFAPANLDLGGPSVPVKSASSTAVVDSSVGVI